MGGNGVNSAVNTLINAYSQHSGYSKIISRVTILSSITQKTRRGMTQAQALSAVVQQLQQQGVNIPANMLPSQQQQQQVPPQPVQAQVATSTSSNQTLNNFMKMKDNEVSSYLAGLENTVKMPYQLANNDTQRIIYDLGLNEKPQVVTASEFDKIQGTTYYRAITPRTDSKGTVLDTAFDVANKTLMGKYTSIGCGMYGNGFYFTDDRSYATSNYGGSGKNINQSVILRMKIDPSKARIVESITLGRMFKGESMKVQDAFKNMSNFGRWGYEENYGAYALYKGYNVISVSSRGFMVPIDRSAMIIDENYKAR